MTDSIGLMEVLGTAGMFGFGFVGFLLLVKNFLYICRPHEALIVTGRRRVVGGVEHGPMIVLGQGKTAGDQTFIGAGKGHVWRYPIIERIDVMDMTAMSIDVTVRDAYSKGNIPLQIHAIANVKVQSDPQLIRNAVERFLGQQRTEIARVAQQTLEGAVREVLAQLTPEQVNEDRLAFAENLMKSAQDDLDKLGLQLDTLKIQNVMDSTGYLDSLGRPAIARAIRDAEKAESQAAQETTQAEAGAHQRSEVAKVTAETAVLRKRNELAKITAELDGEAHSIEQEATAAAQTARAEAELELQQVRGDLEEKRLQAEIIIPAEMSRRAKAIEAQGAAAPTVENGRAVVEVLEAMSAAWREMGVHAKEIYVIQHLEEIIDAVQDRIDLDVQEVNILDPGDGSGIANYAASYPASVAAVLRAIGETTGVNIPELLASSTVAKGGA